MLYVIAIFIPPLALLFAGKLVHAFLNLIFYVAGLALLLAAGLGLILLIPCVIHAFAVIGGKNADKRADRIVRAINQGNR